MKGDRKMVFVAYRFVNFVVIKKVVLEFYVIYGGILCQHENFVEVSLIPLNRL